MRIGMLLAALTCLGLGVLPTIMIKWMDPLAEELVGGTIAASASGFGWMWLTPIAAERASYSAPIAFLGILAVVIVTYVVLHARPGAIHRVPLWDCGFEKVTSRMQYTATSFAMPLRRIFGYLPSVCTTIFACGTASGCGSTSPWSMRASGFPAGSGGCSMDTSRSTLFILL
jgi:hypothetical protein